MWKDKRPLVFTSRTTKLGGGRTREGVADLYAQIARGCYLPREEFAKEVAPWEVRRVIADARIRAVRQRMSKNGAPVFTGDSGLILRGATIWWDNPDVVVRRPKRSSQPMLLRTVSWAGVTVPGVKLRQVAAAPLYEELRVERVGGALVTSPALNLVDLCGHGHALQAFFGAASLIARLARFDRFAFASSQERVAKIRFELARELAKYEGAKGIRRARALVSSAPVGFDSPAEAVVAWLLLAMLPARIAVVPQLPVETSSGVVFIDVALPDHMIALEISGAGKFGESHEVRERIYKFLDRQQRLLDSGWLTVNIRAEETRDVLELARSLYRVLRARGVPIGEPKGVLWQQQTADLYDRDRKF